MIRQAAQEFFNYIKNPDPFTKKDADKLFYNQLFPLVMICLFFAIGSSAFVSQLEQLKWIRHLPEFRLFDIKERKIYLFLTVVFGAPLLEEIIFRYQLKNWYLAFLCWAIVAALVFKIIIPSKPFISIIIALIIITIPFYFKTKASQRIAFIQKSFKYHFYSTAIVFGLLHVSNYDEPLQYGWAVVLLVLPQLFIGFALGYVRMRFGLKNAMLLHAAYNFIPALSLLAGYGNMN
ncbi:CPBP family intramembrane metalloprotease [Pelobium sp.]|nr:CPBP family intramembrane glutamic endopeptidase [Pelobium sp.]MDA9554975.1 CPBP family intramembrane metalloprotease [Pelobium sp.]